MNNTYFTGDLHLYQKNMVRRLSSWSDESVKRDFKDQYEMTRTVLSGINDTVEEKDTLYILGDFAFSKDPGDWWDALQQIRCKNIHYIYGNHDFLLRKEDWMHGRFKSIGDYKRVNIRYPLEYQNPNLDKWEGSQVIILSHYAMRVWDRSHRGSWMLYGHSHTALDTIATHGAQDQKMRNTVNGFYQEKRTMDVGVDNAFRILGQYRPFSFFEIKEIMDDRGELYIDHHEKRA